MAENLPYIKKEIRKIIASGDVVFEKILVIKGETLKEAIEEFDKRWNEDDN